MARPSTADHTDFGSVGLINATFDRTFTIANTGNVALIVGSVSTGGTHAADFRVITPPSSFRGTQRHHDLRGAFRSVRASARAAPRSVSRRRMTTTGDGLTETAFDFAIQGTGDGPGISNFPTTLSFTAMVGNSPASQTFSVTNVGPGELGATISDDAAWLTATPASATLGPLAGQVVTAAVNAVGLHAGVSNALISVADANASNTPQQVAVTLTLTNIPSPTAVTVLADGAEMTRLNWNSLFTNTLVVYRGGVAPSAAPTNNTIYSVGDLLGGGIVIRKTSFDGGPQLRARGPDQRSHPLLRLL
jgi:hypothetical protein